MSYTVVIGLEVHAQLQTRTKIFCGCTTEFRPADPNVQTCPVCLGLPGSLPVLNAKALELGIRAALGLNCSIAEYTKWDRKQYFYPDLPKGYQISQYDLPFSFDGWLDVPATAGTPGSESGTRRVRIIRAHLEEDAGKNNHDESGRRQDSLVDLNRAGTPLVEIVTQPDLRSAEEARIFLEEMRTLLLFLGVSDCNMQEGSLRCDANVNLHIPRPDGKILKTPIVEIKNLNSFRFLEQAITCEIERQSEAYGNVDTIADTAKRTFGFDANRGVTYELRSKEEAADYRYFPDPDLPPVRISAAQRDSLLEQLPERPAQRRARFVSLGLSPVDARTIIDQGRAFSDDFEHLANGCGDAKQAANWMIQDILRAANEGRIKLDQPAVSIGLQLELLQAVAQRRITIKSAREVFAELLNIAEEREVTSGDIRTIIADRKLEIVADTGGLDTIIATVLGKQAKAVADYKAGKQAAIGALIGQVMREARGSDPAVVREKMLAALDALP